VAKGPGLASLLPPPQISRRGLDGFSGAHTDMGVGGGVLEPPPPHRLAICLRIN
jgi:hypothetical protein